MVQGAEFTNDLTQIFKFFLTFISKYLHNHCIKHELSNLGCFQITLVANKAYFDGLFFRSLIYKSIKVMKKVESLHNNICPAKAVAALV